MARILVVDDDPDIVEAIKLFLEKEGHDVATAGSREDGLTALESLTPDLLILDCMMEEADDGMVMAQQLRKSGFTAPIMMLSNISSVTGMEFGKGAETVPVDDFQAKPIDRKTLVEKVNALLSK